MNNNGPGRHYLVEMEIVGVVEDPVRADYIAVYDPQDLHCDTADDGGIDTILCDGDWRDAGQGDAGDGSLILWSDDDNDWGDGDPLTSDFDPEDYTAYEEVQELEDEQLWVRIITRLVGTHPPRARQPMTPRTSFSLQFTRML